MGVIYHHVSLLFTKARGCNPYNKSIEIDGGVKGKRQEGQKNTGHNNAIRFFFCLFFFFLYPMCSAEKKNSS